MISVICLTSTAGISGWVFKTLFGWMDVPDSLCEVVLSFCLLVVTHTALRHLAVFASDFLDLPEQPKKTPTTSVADVDGPDGTRWVIMYLHLVQFSSQPYNCPYTLHAAPCLHTLWSVDAAFHSIWCCNLQESLCCTHSLQSNQQASSDCADG